MGKQPNELDTYDTLDGGWDDERRSEFSKRNIAIGIVLVAAIGVLAVTQLPGFNGQGSSGSRDTATLALGMVDTFAPNPGDQAPDFVLEDQNGKRIRLSELEGKPIFLNFWADWCPFCKQEMPDMQRVHEQFGDDLVVLGVNAADSVSVGENFVNSVGVNYLRAYDLNLDVTEGYRVQAMPTSYFIDANGDIADYNIGFMTFDQMLQKIQTTMAAASAS